MKGAVGMMCPKLRQRRGEGLAGDKAHQPDGGIHGE
jgi:hypothetical protein